SSFFDCSFAIMSNANDEIRSIRLAIQAQIQQRREEVNADLEVLRQRDQESIQSELLVMRNDNRRRMIELLY
ncbi:hypothetical protein PENTCL1PPCAC_24345, partial [Pristionchus entomophagus]